MFQMLVCDRRSVIDIVDRTGMRASAARPAGNACGLGSAGRSVYAECDRFEFRVFVFGPFPPWAIPRRATLSPLGMGSSLEFDDPVTRTSRSAAGGYSAALAVASFSSFSASAFLPAASSFFSSLLRTRSLMDWFQ